MLNAWMCLMVFLSANLDALFDLFLITFNDDGTMLVSSKLTMDQRISLGLNSAFSLRWVAKEHKHYLQYHRTIFIEGF